MSNSKNNKKKYKLSIVIPSFNGEKLLLKNLPKVLKVFPDSEIIVVDDGSTNESINVIKKKFPHIEILRNEKNLGFASSANKGIKKAKSSIVFLLNNDCYPKKDFLNIILPYFKDKDTLAVSCLEELNKGKRGRGVGSFKKGLFVHQPGSLNKSNTLWVFGASTFYKKEIFKKLRGFDEEFNPFFWEDFDLSYRALKSGYKIYFEKKAIVDHQHSSTINQYYSKNQIEKISFRNQLLTTWKNITDRDLILKHLLFMPYHLIFTTLKTRGIFFQSYFLALKKLFKVFKKRKLNQFIYTDKQILDQFKNEIK